MEKINTQREILLVTGSGFAQRQYPERDNADKDNSFTPADKFKAACWNGLIREILPEAFLFHDPETKQFLWQISEFKYILTLELSTTPGDIEMLTSINPYAIIDSCNYS